MSLCSRLRQWFHKYQKQSKKPCQNFFIRDFYNPICFEKTLRQYDYPSLKKKKSLKSLKKSQPQRQKDSFLQNYQQKENQINTLIETIGGLYQNQNQNNSKINNQIKNSYMDDEDDDDEFFNSIHLIEQDRGDQQIQISQKQQNLILKQINPKKDQEVMLLNGQPIFSIPLQPIQLKQCFVPFQNENDKKNLKNDRDKENFQNNKDKENLRLNDNRVEKNQHKKNNKVPNIKTKLSVRMLNKKLRKGATFKNLARQILNRRTIELDGFKNSPNTQIVYQAILAFMEQELQKKKMI